MKAIGAIYANNITAIKVGNQNSSGFPIKSVVKQWCVLSPFTWIILMDFFLWSRGKAMGKHGIKWGRKTFLDLDYADNLSILDESLITMNELLEFLRVQDARIGLKINVKNIGSLWLGKSED
ncbi:uncharacterized protein LOC136039088 [Artemia franciscana]|uniref:uncharacterized protein LOC136039088 n=1 Tax=Artemia franciscana TaxID=6661 RepID=UPI0032DB74D5